MTGGTTQTANLVGVYNVLHGVAGGNTATYPQWFDPGTVFESELSRHLQRACCTRRRIPIPARSATRGATSSAGRVTSPTIFPLFKSFPDLPRVVSRSAIRCFQFHQYAGLRPAEQQSHFKQSFGQITGTLGSGAGNRQWSRGSRVCFKPLLSSPSNMLERTIPTLDLRCGGIFRVSNESEKA